MLRQPIVCVLGHVDHGKTTLLDKIRSTAVAAKEAGGITQAIGATEIPIGTIREICGPLFSMHGNKVSGTPKASLSCEIESKIQIPGLLFLDTPGHEAFTSLRKRGGSCADLAILVVDINEGFRPQTIESIGFLKEFKTPFVVAATKIDSIRGWFPNLGKPFLETIARQPQHAKDALDEKIYRIVAQLSVQGFNSERFDRITDFTKNISIIPCSGRTGEGIPELLMMLSGLAQEFLKEELEIKGERGTGSILEVKDVRGIGTTIDVILYDGKIEKGDWIVIGGREPVVAKIRALLKPAPLKELRVEKQFEHVDRVSAAAGIKIFAAGMEKAIAGSPIITVKNESEIEGVKAELAKEIESIEFEKAVEGIVIKADTLGSLEAMIRMLGQKNIEIRKAEAGDVHRNDVVTIESADRLKKVILAFNVKVLEDAAEIAKERNVKIFENDVIYRLLDDYEKWVSDEKKKVEQEKLEGITRPGKILLLKGLVFRASNPAVVGVEVVSGIIKSGVALLKNGKEIGTIKEIQSEGQIVERAERGQRVAVSMSEPTVGRHISEGDELSVKISQDDLKVLEELGSAEEVALAKKTLGIE